MVFTIDGWHICQEIFELLQFGKNGGHQLEVQSRNGERQGERGGRQRRNSTNHHSKYHHQTLKSLQVILHQTKPLIMYAT